MKHWKPGEAVDAASFAVTIFPDLHGKSKDERLHTLNTLRNLISAQTAASKIALPLLKLARFGEIRSANGCLRHDGNVLSISGIEGDYDGEEMDPQEAADLLSEHGISAIVYTTPSHVPLKPRWRVICPFSREHPPHERSRYLNRVNGVLGGILASESWTGSQAFFYGSIAGTEGDSYITIVDGSPIDILTYLDAPAVGQWGQGVREQEKQVAGGLGPYLYQRQRLSETQLTEILTRMPNSRDEKTPWADRDAWIKIAHGIVGATEKADWAREAFVTWSAAFDYGETTEVERVWDTIIPANVRAGMTTLRKYFDSYHGQGALGRLLGPNNDPAEWSLCLRVAKDGVPRPIHANALLVLRNDPAWGGVISYDEFAAKLMLEKPIPKHGGTPDEGGFVRREWRDSDSLAALEWFQLADYPTMKLETIQYAVQQFAVNERGCHPVRSYLSQLEWDRHGRLDDWLFRYCGADNGGDPARASYIGAAGAKFLISAVARIFKPGCKADCVLVLEGDQGIGKSSVLRLLAGEWFSDSLPGDLHHKDAADHLRGKWILELAELSQMRRSDTEMVKAFISRTDDRYRPAYGRHEIIHKRQCVFAGTTNSTGYLRDETGNRRFWPVMVTNIDLDALRRDRDQIWAEAVHRWRSGEEWWLPDALIDVARQEQSDRQEEDPWHGAVANYLRTQQQVLIADILANAIRLDQAKHTPADHNRVRRIVQQLGWRNSKRTKHGVLWHPPRSHG